MLLNGRVEIVEGDITELDVHGIVNAANETLLGGGGVDGAIHRAAGPGLLEECRSLGGAETGQVKLTGGHRLRASHVLHAVGPVWRGGSRGEPELLANCYENALRIAAEHDLASVAFPCISTGVYRYPAEPAARIAQRKVRGWLEAHDGPGLVIFCCFSAEARQIYERVAEVELR